MNFLGFIILAFWSRNYWSQLDHHLMAYIWENVILILAENLNLGCSYLIRIVIWAIQIFFLGKKDGSRSAKYKNENLAVSLQLDKEHMSGLQKIKHLGLQCTYFFYCMTWIKWHLHLFLGICELISAILTIVLLIQ